MELSEERTRVLCVERVRAGGSLSERCLTARGYERITVASFSAAALEIRRRHLDAHFIEADGEWEAALQLCALVRRRDPHVPTVLYAHGPAPERQRDALRAGATRVLDTEQLTPGEIAHLFAQCIAEAELRNLAAVSAEIAAMHEYLADQPAATPLARQQDMEALAFEHYLANGGTRAGFDRALTALRTRDDPDRYH